MSDMTRLREIAALLRPKQEIKEAKVPQSFDGIMSVVNDALSDLEDKLGSSGNLNQLMKEYELSDVAKDTLKELSDGLKAFKKTVNACLTECETMIHMAKED